MTLQQILYVMTAAQEGSMNHAAEKLYITQPTLTAAIRSLEKELDITIFRRTSHGVILTNEGSEFLTYARQLYQQYQLISDHYADPEQRRFKFKVSTQHYSFAVKAFVETVNRYGTSKYDFAISETRTRSVIEDVGNSLSEIGILYLSSYNRKYLTKLFNDWNLEFHHLTDCDAFVYLYKEHPLAKKKSITYEELLEYPNMSFDQGDGASLFLSEEILSENEFPRKIKVNDRATMLNLMRGLYGYTLCSGIISEELNGTDYVAVPYEADENNPNAIQKIGYLTRKNTILSKVGEDYIQAVKDYLSNVPGSKKN